MGVPVFVQERMEEKQKRRESESCVGLARPEQVCSHTHTHTHTLTHTQHIRVKESHVETVAMEYLRQVGVAESRDLPPMSISALSVAEGQRQHPRVLPLARTPAPTTTPAPSTAPPTLPYVLMLLSLQGHTVLRCVTRSHTRMR